ncbi:histidine utilization repressor [Ancylobacter pratisalsi]|uniref:Histidine utilization repressor n=1 Tax=Ancylobacter pratisalsi TaxID=1745854 RepID=A0A6P1YTT5_9HYPH|nr:histidine utilization repressor [Ancylobacter pratisalsi]QIB35483.1 histidine utilization repressor [Ancylobacter pratisalsi]
MTARPDLRPTNTAGVTLNQRIRADLEARILSGEWPPGHRIPFEHELMAQYGCARMTVNKVIAGLVAAGLIERRRRAGSFVAQPRIHSAVLRIPDIPVEIAARGETYGYELIACHRRLANAHDRLETALAAGAEVLDITCRHLSNGRPFALEERLIGLDTVPEAAKVDFASETPGSWLLRHVPWTEAEHRISAVNASARVAQSLAIPKGAACLTLERRTWRNNATVTFVRQVFRGDLYDLIARFSPQG